MKTDYEEVYSRCLKLCPSMKPVVEYIRKCEPQDGEISRLLQMMCDGDINACKRLQQIYMKTALKAAVDHAEKTGVSVDELFSEAFCAVVGSIEYAFKNRNRLHLQTGIWRNMIYAMRKYVYRNKYVMEMSMDSCEKIEIIEGENDNYKDRSYNDRIEMICNKTGIEKEMVSDVISDLYKPLCLNRMAYDGERYILNIVTKRDLHEHILKVCNQLPYNDRKILFMYYGIDCDRYTYEEISKHFNITVKSAYKRRERALKKFIEIISESEYWKF